MHISYEPAVPLLESQPDVHQKTHKKMFIVTLAIKALNWKQPKCRITKN